MDDLISRKAAIDALGERPIVWTVDDQYTLGKRNQYDIDRLAIETLPSAQRWIPVSERLPEKSGRYLVQYGENSDYMQEILSYYTEEFIANIPKGWHSMDMWESLVDYTVDMIAWMPLPEPYKGEEGEDDE